MTLLTDYTSYADAQRQFASARLWDLFDGDRERLNIAHECIDRHAADPHRIAIRIAHADGRDEAISFRTIAEQSSRYAHWLAEQGIGRGDRVAIMLEPSLAFYAALFGTMKLGAIAVPLFTLFGPDGVRSRVDDCSPRLLLTTPDKAQSLGELSPPVVVQDDAFAASMARYPDQFMPATRADDLAIYQYTSGTTREMPEAIRHTHRAIVVVMIAALYGTGIRPGDRFFCPSSPAWGHGLWHGTLAPLALGVETGVYAGRFDAERLLRALQDFGTTNLSAAATHYRMMRTSGAASRYRYALRKLSFTGEPIDGDSQAFAEHTFGTRLCSMYGTTEVGVILANYPGAEDFAGKPGALGMPVPGVQGGGAAAGRQRLRARRDRRDQGVAARHMVPDQGPRLDRRRWLLLPRRARGRRDHLRRLDNERDRDRGRAAASSRGARGGGDRRAGCAARPGGEGVRRDRPAAR